MNKIRRMLVAKKTETNGGSSMSIDKRKALIGVMIVAAGLSTPLMAEKMVEEIVVTASKRDSKLQDIAGAANVIGGDLITAGGVQTVRDMTVAVPNLSIGDQFGFARVFIRGIGMTSIDIGGEGSVAFLQDGAIVPRPAAQLMGMFDLSQIEVLRGPQGTLYGRGATAGAINLVTNKPGDVLGGYLSTTVGNFGLQSVEGAIDVPMSDQLGMRFAAKNVQRDGYGSNLFSGDEVDDQDAQSYRLTFAYDSGANLKGSLSMQYYEEDDKNYAFHYFGPSAGSSGTLPLAVPILGGKTVSQVGGDIYDINSDQEAINTRDGQMLNLNLSYDISDSLSVTSTTSKQKMDRFLRDDLDSTDANLFGQNNYTEESESFTQEFVLNYAAGDMEFLAGAMYLREDLFGKVFVPLTNVCALLAPATCGTAIGDGLNSGMYEQNGDVNITAYGAYAEMTYSIADNLRVIAGLRYNNEDREGTGSFIFSAAGLDLPTAKEKGWSDVTPRLTLQYEPSEEMMLYATYTEAFKSGVINTGSLDAPLDPETVDAIEVGVKGSNENKSLTYAVTAFYYDYQNLQISFVNEASTVTTVNAAEAENYGAEIELKAQFNDAFSVDFFATYLRAEYKEFINADYGNSFSLTDLSGNTLPNAPEFTAKLGLSYEAQLGSGMIRARAEIYHQDEVFFTEWNRPDAYQDSYELLNASVDYAFNNSGWGVSVWGKNLTGEEIISNNIITAALYDYLRVGSVMPPRTFGATVQYDF
jgi:iron complex outermembrane receptor protein